MIAGARDASGFTPKRALAALVAAASLAAHVAHVAHADQDALPAALARGNAATEAAATLRAEIDALSKEPGGPGADARVALRRIAFDLLFRGAGAPPDAQASAVAGFRLSWLRKELDAALEAAPADAARRTTFDAALAEFAKAGAHGIDRVPPLGRPEESLRELLAPLDRALEAALEGERDDPGTAWPAAQPRGAGSPRNGGPDTDPPPPADDASRVAAIPGWIDLVRSCNARAGSQFEASAKTWTAALRDRARQAAARASIDAFAAETVLARPGAFERAVRAHDAAALAACAGRGADLVRTLDRLRGDWALGWSNGRGSREATDALRRATATMQALEAVAATGGAEASAPLAGWGATAVPPGGWRTHPKALAARAALAAEAVIDGKAEAADRELAVLARDVPVARLERAARERLGGWLANHGGLRARLRAAGDGPGADSFLGAARADLMLASRLLVEEARARAMREDALAEELRARAAAAAARALAAARLPG